MFELKRILLVLVYLILALMVLIFVLENQQLVTLSIFGRALLEAPVSLFIVIAMIAGLVVGPFLGVMGRHLASRKRSSLNN
ncbi:LapA family protein [Pseudomonas poae]|nr:LapA family protein [Pseudomonas poae]